MPSGPNRARILCVDDEPRVVEAMANALRRDYAVTIATSAAEAMALLAHEDVEVILSDMRMPEMDGITLLARAKELKPEVPRILLTGQADMSAAASAIDDGQLFRLLTKPCELAELRGALAAAVEYHRLAAAERVLLEQTLHGSVAALIDILGMTNPIAFGRANRIRTRVSDLAGELQMSSRWQVEMAAMLQPIAYVTLPHETVEKLHHGHLLTADEKKMVSRLPNVTEQLLGRIPRLEDVRAILAGAGHASTHDATLVELGAAVLRIANELEDLEMQGTPAREAVEIVRGRTEAHPARVMAAVVRLAHADVAPLEVREVSLAALRTGMVFVDDVKMASGALLVARGYEVTSGFLARVRNFPDGALPGPLRVTVPASLRADRCAG